MKGVCRAAPFSGTILDDTIIAGALDGRIQQKAICTHLQRKDAKLSSESTRKGIGKSHFNQFTNSFRRTIMKKMTIATLAAVAAFGFAGNAHADTVDAVVLPIFSQVNQDNKLLSDNTTKLLSDNTKVLSDNETTVKLLSDNVSITGSAIADNGAVAYNVGGNMATLSVSAYQTDAIDGLSTVSANMEINSADQLALIPLASGANAAGTLGLTSVHAENTGALSNGSAASCVGSVMVSAINAPSVVGIGGDFISTGNTTTTNP